MAFNCVPVDQWLEHCVSSAKVVGSIPREHLSTLVILTIQMYSLNAKSAKCINVNWFILLANMQL